MYEIEGVAVKCPRKFYVIDFEYAIRRNPKIEGQ